MKRLLIANRGEIAIRIARAASAMGLTSIAMYSEDDADSAHIAKTDEVVALKGRGARAYLDIPQLVQIAQRVGADAVHPGYGFLSENPDFADALEAAGITFVGPATGTLKCFGDKVSARALASRCGVPVLAGSDGAVDVAGAQQFFASLDQGRAMLIKALAGGGGRGMRLVNQAAEITEAFARASSEAGAAFGNAQVYVEEFLPRARHIEVQIIGDGRGAVSHLGERECSIQRRHQKLIEIAPSPGLTAPVREQIAAAAVALAAASDYRSLGTMEFLLAGERFCFIEGNARLQVEHTITEEVLGVDLVRAQLEIAAGKSLSDLGLLQADVPAPRGFAIQCRINMETMAADGTARPAGGKLAAFDVPTGPGIRTDTYGYTGYRTNPAFDSLLAKVIVHSPAPGFAEAVQRTYRALCEFRIEGVATNLDFLKSVLRHERFAAQRIDTGFIDEHLAALLDGADHPRRYAGQEPQTAKAAGATGGRALAGTRLASADPLAVLDHGRGAAVAVSEQSAALALVEESVAEGHLAVQAPMQGTLVSVEVSPGDPVWAGRTLAIMEAMKMEHEVRASASGVVVRTGAQAGDTVYEGHTLLVIELGDVDAGAEGTLAEVDLDHIRPDLQEVFDRQGAGLDENRPAAVAKRHGRGHRTARENVADLCDPGSFIEYGSVVVAGQRRRRSMEDLIRNTTGDGMVCGIGHINGDQFGEDRSRAMIVSYDYMVLAGTQGMLNHAKKDRMFELAEKYRLPTVLFAEGGGGRPGDTDGSGVAGLDCLAFTYFAQLSGLVPIIGITNGRCFAGNAVLLACCDVIIATEGSNIGIGGPAMIEGGGLGIFKPEEVGPMDVQVPNGVVDIAVKDEAEAVAVARQYLSYFQGATEHWEAPDPRELRFIVPENRLRYYDMRAVVEGIADVGSVLEIRPTWGIGIITAFIRVEGRPVGVIANNPGHLSGAIDAPGADKGARFMQLCDAFDIPILSLVDCPGIMVGPEIEKTALVRHAGRMFVVGANIDVPLMTIIIRKSYGLGAQAMAGGSFKAPMFTVTWPTGEFGGMGLEGAVKLGFRKELQAIEDPAERLATYEKMVADSYRRGKAVNMASHFELDDVIDPAQSRHWISGALKSLPPRVPREHKKRPNVDTW
ncbi:MAG: carboxyl transferase domain-containing protein [Pseudomonadales bacterium]